MYYYLHGLISYHLKNSIVIDCAGVGYEVLVCDVDEFPIGETMYVFVSYFAHEDDQYFVGFKTLEEKKMFTLLTSVKGVGPKTALNMIAATSVQRLNDAILNGDANFLMRLPNIGKKTASQILLDLKGQLLMPQLDVKTYSDEMDDALSALKNLGFKESKAMDALNQIEKNDCTTEEYITSALRILNQR